MNNNKYLAVSMSACLLVSGCSVYPLEPSYDEGTLIKSGSGQGLPPIGVLGSAQLITGWRMALQKAASDRQSAVVATNEILFYGTLLAFAGTAGGFSNAHRVRNIGAGAAAGSSLFTSHYQPSVQLAAFHKAADRLECAERAIAPMTIARPEILFAPAELAAFSDKLDRVPEQTRAFISKQRSELQASLQSIKLEPLTKEQWESLIKRSTDAEGAAAASAAPFLNSPESVANVKQRIFDSSKIDSDRKAALDKELGSSPAELAYQKAQYRAALDKFATALEFCLANQPQ